MASLGKESKLLAKHSLIYGLGNALNSLLSFLLLPIYTRYLTPTDYGVKELVGLSTDIIGMLLATAIASAVNRFYFDYDDERNRNEVVSTAILAVGGVLIVALGVLSLGTRVLAKYILDSPDLGHFFVISFVSLWFQSLSGIGFNYIRVQQKSLLFVSISISKLILAIALNIFFIVHMRMGVLGILLSTLITSVVSCMALNIPICWKIGLRFSWEKLRRMLRFGLPLVPSQMGAFIVHLSDRFFIKGYCSVADAGLYSLGYRFGTLPSNFISVPFNQIWEPRRLELHKQEGAEQLFGKIFTYFLFLMVFTGLGVSVLTKDVLKLIANENFWSAHRIVPIIVLANIIFTMHYHFNMGIIISKKTKYLAYINGTNGILNLLLNIFLIKYYGIYGAAVATLISFIYKVSLTYHFSNRFYRVYFEWERIGKIALVAIAIYAVSLLHDAESLWVDLPYKTSLVLSFPLVLLGLHFYNPEEKQKAAEFLKPKWLQLKNALMKI